MVREEAKFQILWFADGLAAKIINEKKDKESYSFVIQPLRQLRERYRLDNQLNEEDLMRVSFPNKVVKILRRDPILGRIIIKTTLDNQPTELSEEKETLEKELESLQEIKEGLMAQRASLQSDVRLTKEQTKEWFKDGLELTDKRELSRDYENYEDTMNKMLNK